MKLLVVVERTERGYSAFSPDLDGCVATGATRAEVEAAMQEAIRFHLDGMRQDGLPAPTPHSYATWCEVAA
jgi:predicted RNase H-like HicB family nuclease